MNTLQHLWEERASRVSVSSLSTPPSATAFFGDVLSCYCFVRCGASLLMGCITHQHTTNCMPTPRFFECHCSRCDAEHDVWRGFRCPRCHKGVVYPPNPDRIRPRRQANIGYGPAPGVSACTACGRVPTASWLLSAKMLEIKLSNFLDEWPQDGAGNMTRAWEVSGTGTGGPKAYFVCAYLGGRVGFVACKGCEQRIAGGKALESGVVARRETVTAELRSQLLPVYSMVPSSRAAHGFLSFAFSSTFVYDPCRHTYPHHQDCLFVLRNCELRSLLGRMPVSSSRAIDDSFRTKPRASIYACALALYSYAWCILSHEKI